MSAWAWVPIAFVIPQHFPHIRTRFTDSRNLASLDSMHPGIICSKGQNQIVLIGVQQVTQLLRLSSNALQKIADIGNSQGPRGIRRELH